jgi:hypothetical protein
MSITLSNSLKLSQAKAVRGEGLFRIMAFFRKSNEVRQKIKQMSRRICQMNLPNENKIKDNLKTTFTLTLKIWLRKLVTFFP